MTGGDAPPRSAIAVEPEAPVLCPNCRRAEYRSLLIDETPFAEAESFARQLCFFGEIDAARDVLMRLAAVRVENTLRLPWLCCVCGAQFGE